MSFHKALTTLRNKPLSKNIIKYNLRLLCLAQAYWLLVLVAWCLIFHALLKRILSSPHQARDINFTGIYGLERMCRLCTRNFFSSESQHSQDGDQGSQSRNHSDKYHGSAGLHLRSLRGNGSGGSARVQGYVRLLWVRQLFQGLDFRVRMILVFN